MRALDLPQGGRRAVIAVVAVVTVVSLGVALRTTPIPAARPVPTASVPAPTPATDASYDLGDALPSTAEQLAGGWVVEAEGDGAAAGLVVATAAPAGGNPLVSFPLDGSPWATATVTGEVSDGWSVAFGIEGPATYWMASLRPEQRAVQLVQVVGGQPVASESRLLGDGVEVEAVARVVYSGRQVQVEMSGVALPTATLGPGVPFTVGLLGRGDSSTPGVARWTSVEVVGRQPLSAPLLPPALGSRRTTAAAAREALGG